MANIGLRNPGRRNSGPRDRQLRNVDTREESIGGERTPKVPQWLGAGPCCKVRAALEFAKYHALGNDYLVMDAAAFGPVQVHALAPRICHRNYGIGSDGILLGAPGGDGAEFELRIINPDGSEAEKSGN